MFPFYKIGTFGGKPDAYISRELSEEYKIKYPYPEVGNILISAFGSIGRTVEYTGKDEYFQDSNIAWLKYDEWLVNSSISNALYETHYKNRFTIYVFATG
jgi:type I restriction enzyme, S subunit